MLFEPVGQDLIAQSIKRAQISQREEKKREITRRREFYDGQLLKEIEKKIEEVFSDSDERSELKALASKSVNILKFVVDEISTVYRYGATRRWNYEEPKVIKGEKVSHDAKVSAVYSRVLEQCNANETLEKIDKLVTNCHDAILRYSYFENFGHSLYPITRNMCDIIQSEADARIAVGIIWSTTQIDTPSFDGKKTSTLIWHYADAEKFIDYDMSGVRIGEERPNPYLKLNQSRTGMGMFYPFFDFHDEIRDESFWRENLDDTLLETAIEVCLWLTYLNGQLKYNTFKQIWKTSAGTGGTATASQQKVGWTKILNAGLNGTMGILDYTVAFEKTIEVLKEKLDLFAKTRGLSDGIFQISKTAESGYSIKLKNRPLSETREKRKKKYIKFEKNLARCIQFASNKTPNGAGFKGYPPEDVIDNRMKADLLSVEFQEPKIPNDIKEDMAYWNWQFENALATPADYLVSKNPDMTLEMAEERIKSNETKRLDTLARHTNAKDYGSLTINDKKIESDL